MYNDSQHFPKFIIVNHLEEMVQKYCKALEWFHENRGRFLVEVHEFLKEIIDGINDETFSVPQTLEEMNNFIFTVEDVQEGKWEIEKIRVYPEEIRKTATGKK